MSNGRNSSMIHNFNQTPRAEIPRSAFNLSSNYKSTFNTGQLIPVWIQEALPGDTWNVNMTVFARMATPIVPLMDNLYLDSFFFAVPYRLVWSNWEKFNGAQDNPGDSIAYTIPTCTGPNTGAGGIASGTLQDYMGLPTGIGSVVFNNLHPRAYNLIWNTWFRDQNLQNSVTVDTGNGPDTYSNYVLLQRGKRHDYFTSCLPTPQKGAAVTLPLGTSAPVKGIGKGADQSFGDGPVSVYETGGGHPSYTHASLINGGAGGQTWYMSGTANSSGYPTIYADLSNATAATINQLRQSFQIQRLLERDMRGGTRYTEILRSHFGVISPDARLQRPELLGSSSSPVNINPVAQTSGTSASGTTTPLGNLAAFGTLVGRGHGFMKSFTEHCLLIGMVCVRADLNYQQGLNRMWSRQTRYDFYWPAFAHLGEQAVLNQEIYCNVDSNDALTFGYQERYAEYRYQPSLITGQFRSTYSTPLDYWHLAQKFSSVPSLNNTFIVENPPMTRVLAAGSNTPHWFFDAHFRVKAARPMPTYGVPGLIDHL